jgi:diguanylate cyclase (GGDEF)-like protein
MYMEPRIPFTRPELQPEWADGRRFVHSVRIYERESFLADSVAQYAAQGIKARDAVVIVAKDGNRTLFEEHMDRAGVDFHSVTRSGQLTVLSAEQTLAEFMVAGWPDRSLFQDVVGGVIRDLAAANWKGIRVFAEMGAVLWDEGQPAAAQRLEALSDELAETEGFSLLCAYPLRSFQGASRTQGFLGVCDCHSLVLPSESYISPEDASPGTTAAPSDGGDRNRFVARLQQLAESDRLTSSPAASGTIRQAKFPNPELAEDLLRQAFRPGAAGLVAVFSIGLDDWSRVVAHAGRSAADEVLADVAWRLHRSIELPRTGKRTLIRTGVEEFTVVAEDLPGYTSVEDLALGLQKCFSRPFTAPGCELTVSACIGIGFSPPQASDAFELQQHAETALWYAKRQGKGQTEFYSARMGKSARLYRHLEARLRDAIRRGELELHFQPEVDLRTFRPARYEALMRWFPSDDCSVPPATFIPVAEESGLIIPLGKWALHEACLQAAAWQAGGLAGTGVAVNVSAVQFADPGFVESVSAVLEETGLRPDLLELELTESLLVRDFGQSQKTLALLKQLGVTVAIDDFGTGYSSLGYLQRLSVDALKFDKCFVTGLGESGPRRRIKGDPVLRGLINIAHELGIRVIVEGVETQEQCRAVAELGCDEVQGFLLGRPEPQVGLCRAPLHSEGLIEALLAPVCA